MLIKNNNKLIILDNVRNGFQMCFSKYNGEECDSNEFLSLDSNISGKSTSSDNSASGKYLYIVLYKCIHKFFY